MGLLRSSLMARLLMYFLLLSLVSLVVVGFVSYDSGRRAIIRDVASHLESVAIVKEQQIRGWVEHLEHTMLWVATHPVVADRVAVLAERDAAWECRFRDNAEYFIQGKTETYVSGTFHSLSLGRPTMVVSTAVRDEDGRLLGVLAGHASLDPMNETMLEWSGF